MTPYCRFCPKIAKNKECSCTDYKRCRDCPMPRAVMIADAHPEVKG